MDVKEDLNRQIVGTLENAKFPLKTLDAFLDAFPDGKETTYKSGDVELKIGDTGNFLIAEDFPFESPEDVADVLVRRTVL